MHLFTRHKLQRTLWTHGFAKRAMKSMVAASLCGECLPVWLLCGGHEVKGQGQVRYVHQCATGSLALLPRRHFAETRTSQIVSIVRQPQKSSASLHPLLLSSPKNLRRACLASCRHPMRSHLLFQAKHSSSRQEHMFSPITAMRRRHIRYPRA